MTGRQSEKRLGHWRIRLLRIGLAGLAFCAGVALIPPRWCAREGRRWFEGDASLQQRLALGVEQWIKTDLGRTNFSTGSSQFDGEWLFGTYLMAGLGFGQTAIEHPEWRERHLRLMDRCIERILSPPVRAFDTESWHSDALETLDGSSDHAAFLGYFNLLLSFQRVLATNSSHAELNDRITAALARRLRQSPILLLQTYPGEVYPVDNCAVAASIGLYDRATGADHRELLRAWRDRLKARYIDARTGLLIQAVGPEARRFGAPRGSGTALGSYFLSFYDHELSAELFQAMRRELADQFLGFGMVREYPRHIRSGRGDIDSGPVIWGYGVSSTGFLLAGCRLHGDPDYFSRLYATAHLIGAPGDAGGIRHYVTGGPIGDAILFAMLTARPTLKP